MFSRFFVQGGTRFIATQHIISIADTSAGCTVTWQAGDDIATQRVEGTAQENVDRLKAEELDMINAAVERQSRADRGLPLLPIPRGKVPR
jgi:hypothetical protein